MIQFNIITSIDGTFLVKLMAITGGVSVAFFESIIRALSGTRLLVTAIK